MRAGSKEVDEFRGEVARYCKEIGVAIAWEFGGSHIKVRDGVTMRSILGDDGVPLTLPTTPGDRRWKDNARAEFRRAGLLPKAEPGTGQRKAAKRELSLTERVGRALRPDLSRSTRRALIREISELIHKVSTHEREAA